MALDINTADWETIHLLLMLRDDTEEDLVGSDLHQDAITEIHAGIATYAQEQGLSWYITKQVMLIAPMPGREDWHPSPDIYVVPNAPVYPRASYDAHVDPVPPFIVEVASPSTVERDLDSKRRGYEILGVREYLIFDPTGESLGVPLLAWHASTAASGKQAALAWEPWEPDEQRTWRSDVLGLGFRPEGVLLRVVRPDGRIVPTRSQLTRQIAEMEAELRRLREQISDA